MVVQRCVPRFHAFCRAMLLVYRESMILSREDCPRNADRQSVKHVSTLARHGATAIREKFLTHAKRQGKRAESRGNSKKREGKMTLPKDGKMSRRARASHQQSPGETPYYVTFLCFLLELRLKSARKPAAPTPDGYPQCLNRTQSGHRTRTT